MHSWRLRFTNLWKKKGRAEDKVTRSELIRVTDIQELANPNSRLLEEALDLHCAYVEPERNPDD